MFHFTFYLLTHCVVNGELLVFLLNRMKMIRWLPLMIAVTLSNHVRGSVAVQWSMSIPAQVTGTKGQAVVLPCSFTHPQQDTYTGGIRVIWRIEPRGLKKLLHSEGGQIIFQCHVSNSTEGSAGCVDPNAPKRFRLQGDPRLRDLSLHIEDLQPSDSSTYYCRVELDADQDKYGDVNGIKLHVLDSVAVQWSMSIPAQVTGTKGQAVVLPCSFTHPQQDTYTGGIRIIWSVETLNGQVIFQCHVSNNTEGSAGCVDPKAPKRFRLHGDPRLRDLSLHIEDLQPSDSSTYYCRVELDADKDKYGDVNGIKLHVLGSVAVQWSMSIPAQVTGTKGQAVVLPCSFTHPQQDTYTGGIRVIWRVVSLSGQVIFQCHVSNSTEGSSAGCVDPKAPKRFHLQGDPRLRDLSLHIEDLQPSDSSTYYCRVELDADKDKYGDVNGTKLQVLGSVAVQWSMSIPAQVTGTKGQAVVLPCSFTHPQQDTYTGGIRVIWRVVSLSGQVIFQCHVSNSTEGSSAGCVDPKAPKRFHLQGDPRLRDLSLHIEDLQPSDSSTYYCRVELDADQDKYGDVNGTKLQVLETASVLNVSWETESGTNKLVCTAQGLPLPRVSWLEAGGDPIILNTSLASYPDQHVSTATLLVPRPNKRYVCLVENELGRSVWISAPLVGQPDFSLALLLLLLLGIKLLLLLGIIMMGIVMMKRVQQEKTA
ncbi:uncharacterized protein [Lepisosteus oculatus]|uniref:uncharacterized protein n=1 Tax=Lepisosteus oculatus TaxID=7918 RepID=UPI0035F5242A